MERMSNQTLLHVTTLASVIRTIRGQKVILDSDLARIYGVPTKALNQAGETQCSNDFRMIFCFSLLSKNQKS